jgi:hypothetical protein
MPFAPHRLPSPHRRPLLDTPHQSAGAIDVSPHLVVTVEHVKAHAQRVRIPPLGAMASGSPAAPVAGGGVAATGEIRSEIPATQAVAKCRAGLRGRRYQAVVLPADLRRPVVGRVRVLGRASVDHRERPTGDRGWGGTAPSRLRAWSGRKQPGSTSSAGCTAQAGVLPLKPASRSR